ncbi:MAG: isoprenylcysteine carboxylmethyltransferase family protein [Bacteroidota bacterium]|jgi:protein-S-isoprenylcysteine O-methyltransferase Ste14
MSPDNELDSAEKKSLILKIVIRFSLLPLFFGVLVLIPAGTFDYWQLYLYLAVLMCPMIFVLIYFVRKDPRFLDRRMRTKEKEKEQKIIVFITSILYLTGFLIPGFDRRFGWSEIPAIIVLIADLLVFLSYLLIFFVFKENSFASRIIEIDENQTVISKGPYSIVRHPMYSGMIVMWLATPLALGSYWAFIPFSFIPFIMIFRALNEEKILSDQLPGYSDYCKKVRYRLIPFIW